MYAYDVTDLHTGADKAGTLSQRLSGLQPYYLPAKTSCIDIGNIVTDRRQSALCCEYACDCRIKEAHFSLAVICGP